MKKAGFLYSLILTVLAVSCDKKLNIAPENTLVERDVFKTADGAEEALSEAYYDFLSAETNGFAYT